MAKGFEIVFGNRSQEKVEAVAKSQEITQPELIERAVVLYVALSKELADSETRRIAIVDGNNIIEKFILA